MFAIVITTVLATAPASAPVAKPPTNTICPVLGRSVDERSRIAVVHGQAYRVSTEGCSELLIKNPYRYLNLDGSIKRRPR
jgi:hypothetical protein